MPTMPAIPTIVTAINSIKAATDIAKALRNADVNLAQAELKLRAAELLEALADAKISMVDLEEALQKKDKEIARLTDVLSVKANVAKSGDAYFETDSEGKMHGEPFCVYCWEQNHRLVHIHHTTSQRGPETLVCPECKIAVEWVEIRWPKNVT